MSAAGLPEISTPSRPPWSSCVVSDPLPLSCQASGSELELADGLVLHELVELFLKQCKTDARNHPIINTIPKSLGSFCSVSLHQLLPNIGRRQLHIKPAELPLWVHLHQQMRRLAYGFHVRRYFQGLQRIC